MTEKIPFTTFLAWAGVPDTYRAFPEFSDHPERDKIFSAFTARPRLILFSGKSGSGKTTWATAMFNQIYCGLLKSGWIRDAETMRKATARWTRYSTLAGELKAFHTLDFDRERMLKEYTAIDLLLIDDVFAERNSDYDVETFTELIDRRLRTVGRTTIITTNRSLKEINESISERLADRFLEGAVLVFKNDSFRMKNFSRRYESRAK